MGWRKAKKMIIKGHSGKVRSGEMTAILGPSGAGKTTLLKILAGYTYRNISGRVTLNGKTQMHRLLSRYIMQEDDVHSYLTVREVIEVAAKLKIPSQSTTDHREIVSEVIGALGLTQCQNTKTKHLSGGERKRLSVSQELVNNPPVLFLDEPTSGLDSTTCINLVRLLKQLSDKGHTIISTIHQPSASVLALFDKLYVIADGECVYQDSVSALLPFLESQGLQCPQYNNPADYIMEVVLGCYGEYNEQFKGIVNSKGSSHFTEETHFLNHRRWLHLNLTPFKAGNFPVNPFIQFNIILFRTYLSTLRNPVLTQIRLAAHILIPLLTGAIFWNIGANASMIINNTSFIFGVHVCLQSFAMAPILLTFPSEMSIFMREQANNWYHPAVYYIAKTAADIPFQVVFSVITISIVYWMSGQPPELFRFGIFLFLLVLKSLVDQTLGLVIGAAARLEMALFMAGFMGAFIVMLSGYGLQLSTAPSFIQWMVNLSYFRFSFQASMQVIYGFDRNALPCLELSICRVSDPEQYLRFLGLQNNNVWYDILAITVFLVSIRAIGYGFLKWKIYFRK